MIFPGFPGVLSFFQVFQVEWEPCILLTGDREINHRLEITSDSVYSLRVQFQGQFRDFLFPFIMCIRPAADQTRQNNAYSQYALHKIKTKTKTNPE